MPFIIAIDGPSASGKGTLARKLSLHFDFAYLDTGLLYRAVGMAVVRAGGDPADLVLAEQAAKSLSPERAALGDDETLRSDEAGIAASKVGGIPTVRAALLKFQQDFCANPPHEKRGAVLDGRDIGTVIAPHAQVKIFVTASAEARAERRFKELKQRGIITTLDAVLADMLARDARDFERILAPTKQATDAVMLDTTLLTAEQALQMAIKIASGKGVNKSR